MKNSLYFIGFSLLFCVVYFKLIHAGFVSWDDGEYVTENKDVKTFNLHALFTQFYVGNYHPITMLNYAIDWKIFRNNPTGYHIENILWHFINAILVYYLAFQLLKNRGIALLIAIVFAFHPMQIETIAWISERKNLLASFFMLTSLLFYIKFHFKNKFVFIAVSFILFCLSLLSKPSFIIFPLLLIMIDWHFNQLISKKSLIQKIPFIMVAALFAYLTLQAQKEGGFLNDNHDYKLYERIGYAGYAVIQYINHFFNPSHLSVIYPYPQNKTLSLVIGYVCIGVFILIVYKLVKNKKSILLFGLLFFLINLLLVLQFIPFGEVLTADRYLYVSIIGLSWLLFNVKKFNDKQVIILGSVFIIILGSLSFIRTNIWQNSIALYKDILVKYPHSYVALNSIGAEYMKKQDYKISESYYNKAIFENINFHKSYYNRALLYSITNEPKKAIADYTKAIDLKNYYKAYIGRANIYYLLKDFPKAIADAESALKINDKNTKAHFILANCYDDLNNLEKALYHYNKAINTNSDDASLFLRRAVLYGKQQQFSYCLRDLDVCTNLQPNYAEAYYWKGVAKVNLKQNPCLDFKKSMDLGFEEAKNPFQKYCY